METYAISPVPPSNVQGSDFPNEIFTFEYEVKFPLDGEYTFKGMCDNKAQLYVDDFILAEKNTAAFKKLSEANQETQLEKIKAIGEESFDQLVAASMDFMLMILKYQI